MTLPAWTELDKAEKRIAELESKLDTVERDFQESYASAAKWQGLAVEYHAKLERRAKDVEDALQISRDLIAERDAAESRLDAAEKRARDYVKAVDSAFNCVSYHNYEEAYKVLREARLQAVNESLIGAVVERQTTVTAHIHDFKPSGLVPNERVCSCGQYYVER